MDVLANAHYAPTLESMAISDPDELGTDGGASDVDRAASNLPKAKVGVSAVDKKDEGAQRAGDEHRSAALGAMLFGTQPLTLPWASEADTTRTRFWPTLALLPRQLRAQPAP